MKEFYSVFRLALAVIALPLFATAAVSSHNYFTESESSLVGEGPMAGIVASKKTPSLLAGTFRNHTVSIGTDGVVRGRLGKAFDGEGASGVSNLKVFFIRDGKIAYQGYSADDGSFQAAGLEPGAYSFVATGSKGFAAFGVRLSDSYSAETNNIIEVSPISPEFDRVVSILGDDLGLPAAVLAEMAIVDNGSSPAPGSNVVSVRNGVLLGNVNTLVDADVQGETKVYLLKDKELVGSKIVSNDGGFQFEGIESGVYEFVSKGPEGISALSFEAIDQDSVMDGGEPIVAFGNHISPALDVTSTVPGDQQVVGEQLGYAHDIGGFHGGNVVDGGAFVGSEVGCGVAAGGCCGGAGDWGGFGGCGGGFGGGGFGGGGALASIARFAILGWILTELFDNIDFSAQPAPPVSPINP